MYIFYYATCQYVRVGSHHHGKTHDETDNGVVPLSMGHDEPASLQTRKYYGYNNLNAKGCFVFLEL